MTMKLALDLPGTPPFSSQVVIDRDGDGAFPATLESCLQGRIAYWIWDETVFSLWRERLEGPSFPTITPAHIIRFPASEANKRLTMVERLAGDLLERGADRGSALIAVGGGVTGDVVGFLAAILLRGFPHIQGPTTLLAQVDSSVGGKTGVDLEQGKNLLGAFHQPQLIWMNLQFLETLPPEEFRQGMAEVIKTAMLGDATLWRYLEAPPGELRCREREALCQVDTACCRLKAEVVQLDEKEAGHRRVLNLGHTVGHALERLSNYQIRHGDAVAIGLVAAANLAVSLGNLAEESLTRLETLCRTWELPVRIPPGFSPAALLRAMQTDKKHIRGRLHFILPVQIGRVMDYEGLRPEQLEAVLGRLLEP